MVEAILVINSGSSSIKFSLFCSKNLDLIYHGEITSILSNPNISIFNASHTQILIQQPNTPGHDAALKTFFCWLNTVSHEVTIKAVGHRVVHGGQNFSQPAIITNDVIKRLEKLIPLAPLHQPHNIEGIKIIQKTYPNLLQIACFDTTFHRTQDKLSTLFAIPKSLNDSGIIRYGFHGISYEYISSVLNSYIGDIAMKRIIVAHLGNGASMCALFEQKSIATSMGFTALDGLVMGTRSGRIDPGVLLYLASEKGYSTKQLEHLLYNESGLLGVSGVSSSIRELLSNTTKDSILAIDLFCYRAAQEIGSLCVSLNGIDGLVFTAGIGENAPTVRKKICERLQWLGVHLEESANLQNSNTISTQNSKIVVAVIPTNEELMIAKHVASYIK